MNTEYLVLSAVYDFLSLGAVNINNAALMMIIMMMIITTTLVVQYHHDYYDHRDHSYKQYHDEHHHHRPCCAIPSSGSPLPFIGVHWTVGIVLSPTPAMHQYDGGRMMQRKYRL